ncbi:MAG: type IX secretion system membrane protein PorP/SprF [Bacteroidia bacterium]|nr:type IX secretion system membrane protein PorP/SprF [Bacteroidia bacterium]
MKTFKNTFLPLILILGCGAIKAQQDAMYTHYMYNTLVINPAYAGSREALTITGLHRSQWVNYKGAPMVQTLSLHSPLRNEHLGIGLSVTNDKIGPTNNTSAVLDFAYIMKLNKKSKLALGLSAGANMFQANLSSVQLDQQADPSFKNDVNNRFTPNFGFGAYYSRERFYAGVSIPKIMQNNYSDLNQTTTNTLAGKEQRHYYFIAGGIIKMTDNLDFKPTTFIKVTSAAPIQADVTASFIIMKKVLLGAMFRTGDAFGALVGLDLTEQFHVGYSYDYSYGLENFKYHQGSHEIVLRYDFIFSSKKQIRTPRYF